MTASCIIDIKNLVTRFGDHVIHNGLNLTVEKNEIVAIVGGSGSGKTTLLNTILMLHKPVSGSIKIFGIEIINNANPVEIAHVQHHWGVMFQSGALFSGMTVLDNVCFPLREFTTLKENDILELANIKLNLAQYPLDEVNKFPAEISGGMVKRASMARSLAMDPELLILDEPTAGLDPITASGLDELVLNLRDTLGLTIIIATHDLDTLWQITDQVAFLGEKKLLAKQPMAELILNPSKTIQKYFDNERSRRFEKPAA